MYSCVAIHIFSILLMCIISAGIALCFFVIVVHPREIKFNVTNASLSEFNCINNALHYNLALNITLYNHNKHAGIYYDHVQALVVYQDVVFGSQTFGTLFQHTQNASVLSPVFKGAMPLSEDQLTKLNMKSFSVYHIDVKLYMKVRFKVAFKISKKLKVYCHLQIPLKSNDQTKHFNRFQAIRCHY